MESIPGRRRSLRLQERVVSMEELQLSSKKRKITAAVSGLPDDRGRNLLSSKSSLQNSRRRSHSQGKISTVERLRRESVSAKSSPSMGGKSVSAKSSPSMDTSSILDKVTPRSVMGAFLTEKNTSLSSLVPEGRQLRKRFVGTSYGTANNVPEWQDDEEDTTELLKAVLKSSYRLTTEQTPTIVASDKKAGTDEQSDTPLPPIPQPGNVIISPDLQPEPSVTVEKKQKSFAKSKPSANFHFVPNAYSSLDKDNKYVGPAVHDISENVHIGNAENVENDNHTLTALDMEMSSNVGQGEIIETTSQNTRFADEIEPNSNEDVTDAAKSDKIVSNMSGDMHYASVEQDESPLPPIPDRSNISISPVSSIQSPPNVSTVHKSFSKYNLSKDLMIRLRPLSPECIVHRGVRATPPSMKGGNNSSERDFTNGQDNNGMPKETVSTSPRSGVKTFVGDHVRKEVHDSHISQEGSDVLNNKSSASDEQEDNEVYKAGKQNKLYDVEKRPSVTIQHELVQESSIINTSTHILRDENERNACDQHIIEDEGEGNSRGSLSETLLPFVNDALRTPCTQQQQLDLGRLVGNTNVLGSSKSRLAEKLGIKGSKLSKQKGKTKPKGNVDSKPKPVLSASLTKSIVAHFSRRKISKDAWDTIFKMEHAYYRHLSQDLFAFAQHARRHTIQQADIELLFRRQGHVTDNQNLNSLIEYYLPMEYREELIPCAFAGNRIYPKPK